ncbi:MAG: hypothetical protein IPH69_00355 [Bacteroidales bacterium]|nr:hypothetical protein [Bacteroidales bacterium]MBK7629095.1 hypothetical protein [Bacteroidales bacterium]
MLLRFFKGTGPGVILVIVVTLLAVWFRPFIQLEGHFTLYFDLNPMPLYGLISSLIGTNPVPGIILSLSLVSLMAILIVNLNSTIFFINERTFLPAFIYILLSGLIPQFQLLNPAIFSSFFLMIAIRRIMAAYRIQGTAYSFFDAGILIGTGTLFYANLIWFGLLIIIGIAIMRTGNLKEIAISVIGLLTPFIMTIGIYYVLDKDLGELLSLFEYNLFGKLTSYDFSRLMIVTIIYLGFVLIVSISYLLMVMNTKKIQARKTFFILIWVFLISGLVYVILPSVSVEIIWITGIPVSYFLTHYFIFSRKKLIPEILFSVFFILVIMIQVLYLF